MDPAFLRIVKDDSNGMLQVFVIQANLMTYAVNDKIFIREFECTPMRSMPDKRKQYDCVRYSIKYITFCGQPMSSL